MASKTWKIIIFNMYINRPQKLTVLYNYKIINTALNLLG